MSPLLALNFRNVFAPGSTFSAAAAPAAVPEAEAELALALALADPLAVIGKIIFIKLCYLVFFELTAP